MRRFLASPPFAELAVLALGLVLFTASLGRDALRDWDEATNACVVRDTAASGDWLSPRLDGGPFSEKPPLLLWLVGASFRALGETELAARLPVALLAAAGVAGTLLVARRLGGRESGLLAALVLTTAPQWLRFSRQFMFDVPLAAAWTFALLGALEGSAVVVGVATAAALMIKGVAAWLLPALLLAAVLVPGAPRRPIVRGVALAVVLAAPWHVYEIATQGRAFVDAFVGYNLVERALVAVEGHAAPWWYYLDRVFVHWANPWHWVGAVAVMVASYRAVRGRAAFAERLVALWFVAVVVAFSLARTKLHWYVTPAYPALAALTAAFIAPRAARSRPARGLVAALAVATVAWSAFEVGTDRLANPAADATRAVLRWLPPPATVPVLLVELPLPLEAARFYARRPARGVAPGAAPAGPWLLAGPDALPPPPGLRVVARYGPRVLLGPTP